MKQLKFFNLVFITLLLALFLPKIAHSILDKPMESVHVYYSEVLDDFIIQKRENNQTSYQTSKGETMDNEGFAHSLPFSFAVYLLSRGEFPAQFSEWSDADKIKENSQHVGIKPQIYHQKTLPLFTLFESNPTYLQLNFNPWIIRNTQEGVEFLNLNTLKVHERLSAKFTQALKDADFSFPFRQHFGNPNPKKPFDEGAFLIDSKGEVYHLKMRDSEPKVARTGIVSDSISLITVNEHTRREFYGILIDREGAKLVSYDNYRLIPLPNDLYNPIDTRFRLGITPLSRTLALENSRGITMYHLDENYREIKRFNYSFSQNERFEFLKKYIFPFVIKEAREYRYHLILADFSPSALWLSAILTLGFVLFRFRKERAYFKALLVFAGGIYGFIAVCLGSL